ncbi:MAG TPA: chemotaxis protein CheW [Methyloceanibacter sp.]|nr:chemotaxis protein CheW [Methyloceanibacter sp.]
MDELLGEFLTETNEGLDQLDIELVRFEQDPNNAEMLNTVFRLVHTVKGTCGFLGLTRLAKLAHAAETLMGQYRDGAPVTVEGVSVILKSIDRIKQILEGLERDGVEPQGSDADLIGKLQALALSAEAVFVPVEAAFENDRISVHAALDDLERAWRAAPGPEAEQFELAEPNGSGDANPREGQARAQTVRVSVDTLEHLMTTVSELVLTRNQLLDLVRRTGESEFKSPLQRLSTVTAELQEGIMKARMQPIANAWQKLPRLVRELSLELDKKIELDMIGADTELDRQVLEMIKDPLTHMIRNSADHGIESPAERVRTGKSEVGRIKLSAYQQGGYIVIEVADDGRGLDAERIRAKAHETGLASLSELDRLNDNDAFKFIFRPGFSTARAVSGVSGRGVGMDVVRNNIELIGGTVELKSTSKAGTTFVIKIPLTLAIMAALIVEAGGHRFAIPQFSVVELVRTGNTSSHRVEVINDTAVLRLRDKLLPLLDLAQLLKLEDATTFDRIANNVLTVVVIQTGARLFGVLVDCVFRTEEIVVKPMSSLVRHVSMFSGNTILGDGSVIMIIDPNALGSSVSALDVQAETDKSSAVPARTAAENKTALLLFRAGTPSLKAVPLSLITRLEEIAISSIERCNGEDVVQYRGALMPLVYVETEAGRRGDDVQPVLVLTEGDFHVGLAVDEIVDIVEEQLAIELEADAPGIIGAAIVKGKAVEMVDVSHYLGRGLGQRLAGKAEEALRAVRLLLVDDSQFFRSMLAPLLAARGYEVTLAGSAEEALALKDKGVFFDLIVSDLDMPGMDGIALAERLKADPVWAKTPLIALSSHSNPRLIERSRAAGFVNYVGKFDRQKLILAIEDCCRQWGAAA